MGYRRIAGHYGDSSSSRGAAHSKTFWTVRAGIQPGSSLRICSTTKSMHSSVSRGTRTDVRNRSHWWTCEERSMYSRPDGEIAEAMRAFPNAVGPTSRCGSLCHCAAAVSRRQNSIVEANRLLPNIRYTLPGSAGHWTTEKFLMAGYAIGKPCCGP